MLLNLLRRNPEEKLARLQIPLGRVVALGPGAVASLRASLIPAKLGAGLVVPESAELISGSAVTDVHLCGDVECLEKSGGTFTGDATCPAVAVAIVILAIRGPIAKRTVATVFTCGLRALIVRFSKETDVHGAGVLPPRASSLSCLQTPHAHDIG